MSWLRRGLGQGPGAEGRPELHQARGFLDHSIMAGSAVVRANGRDGTAGRGRRDSDLRTYAIE